MEAGDARIGSSGSSVAADVYSLRLELATERQKRQIAEDRARLLEEKQTLDRSTASLLSKMVTERASMERDMEHHLKVIESLRQENHNFLQLLSDAKDEIEGKKRLLRDAESALESQRREFASLSVECQRLAGHTKVLEGHVASRDEDISRLVDNLADKDQALQTLQHHYKELAERHREVVGMIKRHEDDVLHVQSQRDGAVRDSQVVTMIHSETVRRMAMVNMEEGHRSQILLGLVSVTLHEAQRVHRDRDRLARDVDEMYRYVEAEHRERHQRVEQQRHVGTLTVESWSGLLHAQRLVEESMEQARDASVAKLEAEQKAAVSQKEVVRLVNELATVEALLHSTKQDASPSRPRASSSPAPQQTATLISSGVSQLSIESLRAELTALNAENERLMTEVEHLRRKQMPSRIEGSSSPPVVLAPTMHEESVLRSQLSAAKEEVESYRRAVTMLRETIQELETSRVLKAVHEHEMERLRSQLRHTVERLEFFERQWEDERTERLALQKSVDHLRSDVVLRDMEMTVRRLENEVQVLSSIAEASAVVQGENKELQSALVEKDGLLRDAAKQLLVASSTIEHLEADNSLLYQQLASLQRQL